MACRLALSKPDPEIQGARVSKSQFNTVTWVRPGLSATGFGYLPECRTLQCAGDYRRSAMTHLCYRAATDIARRMPDGRLTGTLEMSGVWR